jgi:hypothetical protein
VSETMSYPGYATYERMGVRPSVLSQDYPRPTFQEGENYYQTNELLTPYFHSEEEARKFGAANFCAFLDDTIEVEHCLVVPAIVSLRRLPYDIPSQPKQDLYKTATDEGYHAEQSLQFATDLRSHFGFRGYEQYLAPLFLRRLDRLRSLESEQGRKDLITILSGIVTETRIAVELGKFAGDTSLAESVREVCRTHAEDEVIHSSQFRALGRWLWEAFSEDMKVATAEFFSASTIARSLPDVDRIADMLHQSTTRSLKESRRLVYSAYTEDVLIEEMTAAAQSTVTYLRHLGVEEYIPFSLAVERERENLAVKLEARRKEIGD